MSTLAILSTLVLPGCTGEQPEPAQQGSISGEARALTLVYSNNLDGEIEPCG